MSTDNGVIELSNIKIESDDQNCIHSKPRKDVFKLKEELSLRIVAKRKEELMKKQMSTIQIPMEDSDSDEDIETSAEKENDVNDGNNKEDYESDAEEVDDIGGDENNGDEGSEGDETNNGNESINGNDEVDDEEGKEEEENDSEPDGCEVVQKSKQRKRIILMENSDDDDEEPLIPEDDGKFNLEIYQ